MFGSTTRFELGMVRGTASSLEPIDMESARYVACALAAIDPWLRLGIGAMALEHQLLSPAPGTLKLRIEQDGATAGVIIVRDPWLLGPYLQLLAILPKYQRTGLGAAALGWLKQMAEADGSRNLWVCASQFNEEAVAFYEAHGFQRAALLPDLIRDGEGEVLLRKPL